jgi:hypothetical protein
VKLCSTSDCEGKHYAKGLCEKHYRAKQHDEHRTENNARDRRRYAEHREEEKAKSAKRRAQNPEAVREWSAKRYAEKSDTLKEYAIQKYAQNPARAILKSARSRAKKGGYSPPDIHEAELRAMLDAPYRCCAICETTRNLCLDHDHRTGRVRGFLCRKCNTGVGLFDDNHRLLEAAANYVHVRR